jgi:hypothetical protein
VVYPLFGRFRGDILGGGRMLDNKLLNELKAYVESYLNKIIVTEVVLKQASYDYSLSENSIQSELEDFINLKRQPTLQQVLFQYIDRKGVSDPEVYKKAGLDRKLFSKIRSNPTYRPGKNTIIALALALELNKKETDTLLSSAGYTLSDSDTADLVILFCLEKKIYDLDYVNQALDYFSIKPLSGT